MRIGLDSGIFFHFVSLNVNILRTIEINPPTNLMRQKQFVKFEHYCLSIWQTIYARHLECFDYSKLLTNLKENETQKGNKNVNKYYRDWNNSNISIAPPIYDGCQRHKRHLQLSNLNTVNPIFLHYMFPIFHLYVFTFIFANVYVTPTPVARHVFCSHSRIPRSSTCIGFIFWFWLSGKSSDFS